MTRKFSPNLVERRGGDRRRAALAGSSLAALAVMVGAVPAHADMTVTGDRTTPVATSTATSGAPDNVVINSGASVKLGSGTAVTLDSDNTVTNNGTIQIQDQSNATGVLVQGGHTGAVYNTGAITINETTTATDTNGDGNLDGPFATGSNRYGIRVTGSQPFTGPINNSGTITVTGNDSAGISLETNLQGLLYNSGGISVTGTNSYGIRTLGVSDGISIAGAVTATGQGAQALSVGGDVGGQLLIQSTLTSTGYRYPTLSTDTTFVSKLGADDLLQGGPTVSVAGNVAQGVLIDSAGSLISSGAAPGLVVGAVGRDVTLGNVGTDFDAYGLEVRGFVEGLGVYNGVTATGLQLGVNGGGQVFTGGGVHVTGSVIASSAEAGATGVVVNSGVNVPLFQNDGAITSTATATGPVTAYGVVINAGANVPAFANSASLSANILGSAGSAVALVDHSGTLTSIQNIRTISAGIYPTTTGTTITGTTTAIDVSANTSGVGLLQYDTSAGLTPPAIIGAILFGSGSDTADIQAGTVTGDIAFGAGANSLSISGGASVAGAVTADGGTLALAISNGALKINNAAPLNLTSLSLGSQSSLTFTIDPAAGANTTLLVAGPATIADGAKLGLHFTSLLQGSATYTLIQASQLTAGAIDSTLLGQAPYIYKTTLAANAAQGTVTANVSLKSASEVGLSANVAGAYQPALTAINLQPTLRDAILGQTNQAGFLAAFDQLLPNRSSAVFQLAAAQADGVGRALDDRVAPTGGAWAEELNYGVTDKARDGMPGYNAYGVGLIGGYEAVFSPLAIFGADFGVSSSQIRDVATANTSNYTVESFNAGLYWRGVMGRLSANARIGAGYLKINSDRVVEITNVTTPFSADANSRSSGTTVTGRVHLAYEAALGSLYLRPQVSVDYLSLTEAGYTESGGGAGVDLAVQGATSSRSSAFAGLAIGKTFGNEDASWGPELLVGYRDVMTENLASTTAQFVSGGSQFTIPAETIGGGGFAARVAFKGENGYGGLAVEGGAESRDGLNVYDVRLTAHFQF